MVPSTTDRVVSVGSIIRGD